MGVPSVAILIATRNRLQEIGTLLESIEDSIVKPEAVVIVSSGLSIEVGLRRFSSLPIKHLHIQEQGQIRQKQIGLGLIPHDVEWVLFLDDDLKISPITISELFRNLDLLDRSYNVLGLGLSQKSDSNIPLLKRIISKLFRRSLGKVKKSGNNSNYQHSRIVISTEWLNGASMWRREALKHYNFEYLDAKYSICEDLIFSYKISRVGKLFFIPEAKFEFQNMVSPLSDDFEAFRANCYWRLFFVLSNKELSVTFFLFRQFIRSIKFAFRLSSSKELLWNKLKFSLMLFFDCLTICATKHDPVEILKSRKV